MFVVGRSVILDTSLTPTARLLYTVMLATLDMDDAPDTAALVGFDSDDGLAPFLDEPVAAGVVKLGHDGTEIVASVQELPRA